MSTVRDTIEKDFSNSNDVFGLKFLRPGSAAEFLLTNYYLVMAVLVYALAISVSSLHLFLYSRQTYSLRLYIVIACQNTRSILYTSPNISISLISSFPP
jgi:hypothetical protein